MIQNIQTSKPGLPCKVRVMNLTGDAVLTTYDNAEAATCVEASTAIGDFWDRCIAEHSYTPTMFGHRIGEPDFELLRVADRPDFDLGLFDEILIQPAPLTGG